MILLGTVKTLIRLRVWAFTVRICPEDTFSHGAAKLIYVAKMVQLCADWLQSSHSKTIMRETRHSSASLWLLWFSASLPVLHNGCVQHCSHVWSLMALLHPGVQELAHALSNSFIPCSSVTVRTWKIIFRKGLQCHMWITKALASLNMRRLIKAFFARLQNNWM